RRADRAWRDRYGARTASWRPPDTRGWILSAATLGTRVSRVKPTGRPRKQPNGRPPRGARQMTLHERTLNRPPRLPRTAALVARVGLALTLAGALSLLLSGVGARWDWWDYRTGFLLLRWTLYAGLVVIVVALTGL